MFWRKFHFLLILFLRKIMFTYCFLCLTTYEIYFISFNTLVNSFQQLLVFNTFYISFNNKLINFVFPPKNTQNNEKQKKLFVCKSWRKKQNIKTKNTQNVLQVFIVLSLLILYSFSSTILFTIFFLFLTNSALLDTSNFFYMLQNLCSNFFAFTFIIIW